MNKGKIIKGMNEAIAFIGSFGRRDSLGPKQREWVNALRSGKYKQSVNYLASPAGYCCLGVLCEINNIPKKFEQMGVFSYNGEIESLPTSVQQLVKLRGPSGFGQNGEKLAAMNDDGVEFDDIADIIEHDPENWFSGRA